MAAATGLVEAASPDAVAENTVETTSSIATPSFLKSADRLEYQVTQVLLQASTTGEIMAGYQEAVAAPRTYTVQCGDTMSSIADVHGFASWQDLWARNLDIVENPHVIQCDPAQVLFLDKDPQPLPEVIPTLAPPASTPASEDTVEVSDPVTAEATGTGGDTFSLLNQHDWTEVLQCESSGDWHINTGNGYYGGLQFSPQTWKDFGGHDFASNAHEATPAEQIHVAETLLAARDGEQWPKCGDLLKPGITPLPEAPAATNEPPAEEVVVQEAAAQQPASTGVHNPCPGCRLTSGFGDRWGTIHYGTDLASPVGTPVYAAMGGIVQRSGPSNGFGQAIWVLQDDGSVAVYGHIDPAVSQNQRVEGGQQIAQISKNCPECTGPHLHFEVHRDGNMYDNSHKIDSAAWLRERGVSI